MRLAAPHAGTTWGLGGTCVNVGCIPKKLFHYAGQFRKTVEDAKVFGWTDGAGKPLDVRNNWATLTKAVNGSILNQNWTYKDAFKTAGIKYMNAKGVSAVAALQREALSLRRKMPPAWALRSISVSALRLVVQSFLDEHTVLATSSNSKQQKLTAEVRFVSP